MPPLLSQSLTPPNPIPCRLTWLYRSAKSWELITNRKHFEQRSFQFDVDHALYIVPCLVGKNSLHKFSQSEAKTAVTIFSRPWDRRYIHEIRARIIGLYSLFIFAVLGHYNCFFFTSQTMIVVFLHVTFFACQTIIFKFVSCSASTCKAPLGVDANMRTFMAARCVVTLVYICEKNCVNKTVWSVISIQRNG